MSVKNGCSFIMNIILFAIVFNVVKALEPPRITEHPQDVMVKRMEPTTLNCQSVGSPTPTITWFKDGFPVNIDMSHRMMLPGGELFFLKVVHSKRESDAGVYWCEARNDFGVAKSHNATLTVSVLKDDFRLEPRDTSVALGETALLECGPPRGIPEPQVFWRKNGHIMDLTNTKRIRIVDGGNLAIQDARQSDDGRYQCVAKNPIGTRESSIAYLKIHVKPFIIRGPQNQTAISGTSAVFQCRVGGEPLPDVLWRRSAAGGNMPLGRVHILEDRSLRIDDITIDDMGEYICEADNAAGSVISSGILTVQSPPTFTVRPRTQIVDLGAELLFECQATGYPNPTIFWSIEGNRSLLFSDTRVGNMETTTTADGGTILSVSNIDRSDNGKVIVCSAVNSVGSISTRAVISVNLQDDRPPPLIIEGPSNQTLPIKSVTTLPCRAMGEPKPVISWYRDGIPVVASEKINISETGYLTIANLDKNLDSGLYTCVASSKTGKSTWSAVLRLEAPTNPNIKFFRAAESNSLPGAPGKPIVVQQTDHSVTITWVRSNKVGASSLLGYTIEIFARNVTDGWAIVASKVQNTSFTQMGLNTDTTYYFVVRAENAHGLSAPSVISDPVTIRHNDSVLGLDMSEARASLLSGEAVELTNATAVDSTTVKIYWDIINGKYVEGFYIYARNLESTTQDTSYKTLTVLNSGSASSCTITNLMKYTQYEFFIIPFYKSVEGKPSNSRVTRTMEDVPSMAPSNMEALLLNSSAVYLKWKPPPIESHHGLLKNYHIIVRGLDTRMNYSKILTNVTIEAQSPTLLLANLTEGVTYTVSVAAANDAGLGPFSSPSVLSIDPVTKSLDKTIRYPINHTRMDDFLTQPWFIGLLGLILAIMMLSFGAMVFVKRKHMIMKQAALTSMRATNSNGVLKVNTLPSADGFWLDPSSIVWRPGSKEVIPDYAPVCGQDTLPVEQRTRIEYSEYPAEYAEVSNTSVSFRNTNSYSPAPYATSSIIGSNRLLLNSDHQQQQQQQQQLLLQHQQQQNEAYHLYLNAQQQQQQQQQILQQNNFYNRSIHSDSYFNPREKITITENKLANTFNPNGSSVPHTPLLGTMRRTRLKFGRYPSNTSDAGSDYSDHRDEQLYVKVGETTPPINWQNTRGSAGNSSNNSSNTSHNNNTASNNNSKLLKDPDIIYAPSTTVNRNMISYLSKKDFRDDV